MDQELKINLKFNDYCSKNIEQPIHDSNIYEMIKTIFEDAYRIGEADGYAKATTIRKKDEMELI